MATRTHRRQTANGMEYRVLRCAGGREGIRRFHLWRGGESGGPGLEGGGGGRHEDARRTAGRAPGVRQCLRWRAALPTAPRLGVLQDHVTPLLRARRRRGRHGAPQVEGRGRSELCRSPPRAPPPPGHTPITAPPTPTHRGRGSAALGGHQRPQRGSGIPHGPLQGLGGNWVAPGGGGGGRSSPFSRPPVWHSVGLLLLYGALDSHPFFPSHVASGRCVLSAAAAGAPAGGVSAFAEPRRWCAGGCAGCGRMCRLCVSGAQ